MIYETCNKSRKLPELSATINSEQLRHVQTLTELVETQLNIIDPVWVYKSSLNIWENQLPVLISLPSM